MRYDVYRIEESSDLIGEADSLKEAEDTAQHDSMTSDTMVTEVVDEMGKVHARYKNGVLVASTGAPHFGPRYKRR